MASYKPFIFVTTLSPSAQRYAQFDAFFLQPLLAIVFHHMCYSGIFANGHMKYDDQRDKGPNGSPSLTNMTEKAVKILSKNKNGFLLVVEGGMIDQAHHRGNARRALSEVSAMDEAVKRTMELLRWVC